jgi:hypothetical protein
MNRFYNIFLKDYFENKSIVGLEIGMWQGSNSQEILSLDCIKKLYCVDPYDSKHSAGNICSDDRLYRMVKRKFDTYITNGKLEILRDYSYNVLNKIPNNLDFIYIDGNHDYNEVKLDINNYYQKVRNGGIFGGHDYDRSKYIGVKQAVDEFIKKEKLNLWVSSTIEFRNSLIGKSPSFTKKLMDEREKLPVKHSDWWVIKP